MTKKNRLPAHLLRATEEDAPLADLAESLEDLMEALVGPDSTGAMPDRDSDLGRWLRKVWGRSPGCACRLMLKSAALKPSYTTVPPKVAGSWRRILRLLDVLDAERGASQAPIEPQDVVDEELADWLETSHRKWAEGTLPLSHEILLRAHGVDLGWPERRTFSLPPSGGQLKRQAFAESLERVAAWQAEHGVSQESSEQMKRLHPDLHQWLSSVADRYDKHEMAAHEVQQIDKSGIDLWTVRDWMWEHAYQRRLAAIRQIGLHIQRHGHSEIRDSAKAGDPSVPYGSYAATWRKQYAQGALDPEIQERLEALPGWDWNAPEPPPRRKWQRQWPA